MIENTSDASNTANKSNTSDDPANLSATQKRALLAKLLRDKAQARESYVPISHNQKALWFLAQLAPESAAYNLLYSARITAEIDSTALQRAVEKIAVRYPQLTATFISRNGSKNGEPRQKLVSNGVIPFEQIKATSWSLEQLQHYLIEESNRPIDIERGPMLRIMLFKRSLDDYVLAFIAHHIAVDFWALDMLVDELSILYVGEKTGLDAPLAPVGPQHNEYVRWQSEMLAGAEGERHWQYWRETLKGELPVLSLPLDGPRPTKQTYKGASHYFAIDSQVTRQLRKLAQEERVTLFMLMLAAYYALLYRLTNQQDIIVGTPALGRSKSEWEHVIDYLANPVMTRGQLDAELTFKSLLEQVRQQVFNALEHQDFPFPLIVERLQPRRDPSYAAIYQTLFIWDRPAKHSLKDLLRGAQADTHSDFLQRANQESLSFEPFAYGQQGAQLDLALTIFEIDGELTADFRYNTDLFNAATVERFADYFQVILAGIVANAEQKVLELPLLSEKERLTMLVDWNDTQANYPQNLCLHEFIEVQASQVPDRTALLFEDRSLGYRELNEAANKLAHRLRTMGVGPDMLVGVCMERSLEMVVALLGVLKAGGAYVPLDPSYPEERLSYMLQDAQVSVLLTQARFVKHLPAIEKTLCLDAGWDADWPEATDNLSTEVQPRNLAYMIYTSGSTGRPKGVMNTHQGIVNRLYWMQQHYHLSVQDRVLQKTPFSFDVSVWEFFWPLLAGTTLVIARPGGHQNPTYLADLIAEQRITTLHFVPSMLQAFLQEPQLERCASLRRVICSGEALTRDLQDRFFAVFPRGVQLHNLYGPTEAAVDVTYWECQPADTATTVPIGRPIANTQIYIVNEALQPTPVGVAGELLIGGVNLARGYYQRPELTAEKFIRDPFSVVEDARVFRTADLARYRSDGAIEFLGRIDHQVKIRGFRIELGEIEAALSGHAAIKEAVVTAREDMPGNKRLIAYLVPHTSAVQPSIEALRAFLKTSLPDYMIPAAFMFMEAFPLSPNGKINRNVLPIPDSERPQLQAAYVAPRTPLERQLAEIWSRILDIDRIGVHDNYFDLGGASIQGLEIIAQANDAGIPLKTEMLFEFQTIAELAAAVTEHAPSQEPAAEQALQAQAVEDIAAMPASEAAQVHVGQSMPLPAFKNTIIESLGTYLPPKVVTSAEVLQDCRVPIQFPLDRLTGVRSRRMAGETEFSFDIARQAVEDCFKNSRYRPEDIDMIVCGNISRCNGPNFQFTFEPNTAIQLKQYFGMSNAIAFDVSNACTGLFTAINITDAFLKTGTIRRGLVVSGEYISHLILTAQKEIESYMDSRLACLTVGDAGAALILESSADQKVGFHEFEMYTVSRYSEACIGKATEREHGGAIMYTDAVTVSAVNMKQAVAHAGMVLERAQWPKNSFQHVIVHQTSKTTIKDAAREINRYFGEEVCDPDSVIYNIEERGNTATTTHMIAVMDFIRNGRIKTGDNAIFGITGSGATIGTAIYTFDDLPDRIRQREAGTHPQGARLRDMPQKVVEQSLIPTPNDALASTFGQVVGEETDKFIPRLPAMRRIQVESSGIVPADLKVAKNSLDLLEVAALNCLADSAYSKSDIDLLVYSGVYRDDFISEPAIAALLAGKLEMNDEIETQQDKKTFALDLFNSSLGTLDACYAAIGMMHARKITNALIVASEVENNRQLGVAGRVGIEETGSALILNESADGKTGFGQFMFKHFPEYAGAVSSHTVVRNGKMILDMQQDPELEQYYLRCIQETVREFLQREELDLTQVRVILPPQISSVFNVALAAGLHIGADKMVDVNGEHDLFTSSLPYALHHVRKQRLAKAGDIGLIISVGSGIQVGCATYYF